MHINKIYYLRVTDKNGKELNSNSTIKYHNVEGKIFYSVEDCRFKILWEDGFIREIDSAFIKSVEII